MLPRAARLKRKRDFDRVYQRRQSWATPALVLYVRARSPQEPSSRLGFVISKKVAKRAHDRNRLKRRLREICRLRLLPRTAAQRPFDALFVARSPATQAPFSSLAADVETLARQAGLLAQKPVS